MCIAPVFGRGDTGEFFFHGQWRFAGGDAGPVAEAENMGVDGDGRVAKGGIQDDIGRFSADTGQRLQCGTIIRDLAGVHFDQAMAGSNDVPGLGAVEADGLDVFAQTFLAKGSHAFRGGGYGKKAVRCLVDRNIGGLRGKNDSDQQLKWAGVIQLGGRRRIGFLQAGIKRGDLGFIHGFRC